MSMGCAHPRLSHTGLCVACSSKQSSRDVVPSWNFCVQLMHVQMLSCISLQQFQACQSVALSTVLGADVDGHACAALPWLKIIQVQSTRRLPTL